MEALLCLSHDGNRQWEGQLLPRAESAAEHEGVENYGLLSKPAQDLLQPAQIPALAVGARFSLLAYVDCDEKSRR
jgi:hypothetical protein